MKQVLLILKANIFIFLCLIILTIFLQSGVRPTIPQKIDVAIYPYLPRSDQFINVLTQAWNGLNTGVQLNFVNYDCYSNDPPDSLEVFVFDGIYYQYFIAQNYLKQLSIPSINNWMGFMNYAWDAVWTNGFIYGVPYLGCSNVYFYRKSDKVLDTLIQNGLNFFYNILGNSQTPNNPQPPPRQGLLIDLTSGTTDACMYLMSQMNLTNSYSKNPYLPSANNLNGNVLNHLRLFTQMAGKAQATYVDTIDQRINWFSQGYGRSLVGITENLCSFPQNYLDSVAFRILPTADTYLPVTEEFFVDIAGINSKVTSDAFPYALLLLNLMTSYQVMYNSMIAQAPNQNPQFLIPVRGQVLADLMDVHPLYTNMADMIMGYYGRPLQIGPTSRTWLNQTKSAIRDAILTTNEKQKMIINIRAAMQMPAAVQNFEGRFNSRKRSR